MPTATAMGFLTAPQNSTPTTSSLVYTRKVSLVTAACSASAMASSAAAITVADGMSRLDLLGVVGAREGGRGRTRLLLDDLRRPLEGAQLVALGQRELQRARRRAGREAQRATSRTACVGTAYTTSPAAERSASSMATKRISAGSATPGRKCGFSCVALSYAASAAREREHLHAVAALARQQPRRRRCPSCPSR